MAWGRIDDNFYDHPKVDDLGQATDCSVSGCDFLALSWSNRYLTDGYIPIEQVKRLGGTRFLADRLVRVGLWDKVADGYRVHDFLEYNDSGGRSASDVPGSANWAGGALKKRWRRSYSRRSIGMADATAIAGPNPPSRTRSI